MGITPWMTSNELIAAVKRKIALPLNQRTFLEDDILAFANEEMMIAQVPDIMTFHEEYFVVSEDFPLIPNQNRYPIPERAMGGKLRDVYYVDNNGNLFEMTRINADDKAYWQRESATINLMQKYYLEGNDLVLAPINISTPTGNLRFSYFLRPNQLVQNARAAISQSFFKNITIDFSTILAGDVLNVGSLTFTAVSGVPSANQFQIAGTSVLTATNLVNAINLDNTYSASNGSSTIVSIFSSLITTTVSSLSAGMIVSDKTGIKFTAPLPANIAVGSLVDLLQTKPGHKLIARDIDLDNGNLSTDSILFDLGEVPPTFIAGDYVCTAYECIIPQIPPDLHNGLAERTSARILAAQGDAQGLQIANAKIADIKKSEGTLTDNRVDGSTQKVNQRKSMLSFQRMGIRRRI